MTQDGVRAVTRWPVRRYTGVRLRLLLIMSAVFCMSCGSLRTPATAQTNVIPWIAATPSAPTPTPKPTIPAGTPACTAQTLSAQFDGGQGLGGGQLVASVSFTNSGGVACYLQGVPQVSLLDAQGRLMQTKVSGYIVTDHDDPANGSDSHQFTEDLRHVRDMVQYSQTDDEVESVGSE